RCAKLLALRAPRLPRRRERRVRLAHAALDRVPPRDRLERARARPARDARPRRLRTESPRQTAHRTRVSRFVLRRARGRAHTIPLCPEPLELRAELRERGDRRLFFVRELRERHRDRADRACAFAAPQPDRLAPAAAEELTDAREREVPARGRL